MQYKRDNKENLCLSTSPAKIKHQLQIILDDGSSVSVAHLNLKRLKDAIVSGWVVITEIEHTASRDKQSAVTQRISEHVYVHMHVFDCTHVTP